MIKKTHVSWMIALLMIIIVFSCENNRQYTITVSVDNGPDSLMVFNHWYVSSDTTLLKNNLAVFEGVVDSFPRLVSVGFPFPSQERTRLVLEPGHIHVNFHPNDGFEIGGTKNNRILQELINELAPYDAEIRAHWRAWNQAYNQVDRDQEKCERLFDLTEAARARKNARLLELIESNRNYAGFVVALPTFRHADAATLSYYLDHFKAFSDDRRYQDMKNLHEKVRTTTAGHPVADFTLPDPDGNLVSLSDFRGKWVLIDFWYTGCTWCIRMAPHLESIYQDWKDKYGFEILGVSVDRPQDYDKWLTMARDGHAPWTQVLDSTRTLPPEQFGVSGYPTLFLIDPEGKGTIKFSGYKEENILRRMLGEIIKDQRP